MSSAAPTATTYAARPSDSGGGAPAGIEGGRPGDPDFRKLIQRPHPIWTKNDLRYRRLLDAYIGGDTYTNAVYGVDRDGLAVRNLIRHRRETPDPQKTPTNSYWGNMPGYTPASNLAGAEYAMGMGGLGMIGPWPGMAGADPAATAHDDDYEYRRACTPPPPFLEEAVSIHLSKIYDQEVKREGPDDLIAWWEDVDGRGTPMDDWMRETVAPLLLVLGCLDVCLDHPKAPPGEKIETRADELRLGLDSCVASYILPQNVIWWRLDAAGRYLECLIREWVDPSDRDDSAIDGSRRFKSPEEQREATSDWRKNYVRHRYWNARESVLVNHRGSHVLERTPHNYGCVPIVRLFDLINPHEPHAGKSRYQSTERYQRAYYNKDSELIVNDTLQAHPFLSRPEDFCKADQTMSVGPAYLLPKKKNPENGSYEGFEFISPPKDPAESIRRNLDRYRDQIDRINCLAKPAGAVEGNVTGQSGVSKEMDAHSGHKLLRSIVKTLAKAERQLATYGAMVTRNAPMAEVEPAVKDAIRVVYPDKFELRGTAEMAADTVQFQAILAASGNAPMTEAAILKDMVRQLVADRDDDVYDALDLEIDTAVATQTKVKEQFRELGAAGLSDAANVEGGGSSEQAAEGDSLGQSQATAISGTMQYQV
jgi:hypothetical protein